MILHEAIAQVLVRENRSMKAVEVAEALNKTNLKLIKTILPSKNIIEEYNRIIQIIIKKQDNLEIQNEQLSSLGIGCCRC